jgi:hypothetical protein
MKERQNPASSYSGAGHARCLGQLRNEWTEGLKFNASVPITQCEACGGYDQPHGGITEHAVERGDHEHQLARDARTSTFRKRCGIRKKDIRRSVLRERGDDQAWRAHSTRNKNLASTGHPCVRLATIAVRHAVGSSLPPRATAGQWPAGACECGGQWPHVRS